MATVGELMVMIAGNNAPLMGSLGQSEAALRGFSSTTGTHTGTASNHLMGVGVAALGVVGAVGVMEAAGIRAAADFQERMGIINTIAHQTPEELNRTGDALRSLAAQTGASLADMQGGFYDLLSAGVSTGNAMEFLRNATTLSIGGLSTVGQAVDVLTTATNAWGAATGRAHLTQRDSGLVMDVMAKAIERGKVTADQIASSLANVASTAAAMNIPIQEIGATYATLTARGVPAAEATQRLNGALVALQRIPPGMQELQDKTHRSYEEIARTEGVQSAFQQLRDDADRYHVSLIDVMGRQDAMAFVLNVTGAAGRQFSSDLRAMYDSSGTAAGQAEERMGTFNRQLDILGSSVNSALISVATALLPALSGVASTVSGVVQTFTAWSNANPGLASNILLVVGGIAAFTAAVAFLGPILGAIGVAIGVITSPITLLIAALATAAAGLGVFGDAGRTAFDSVVDAISGLIPQTGLLRDGFETVRDVIANVQAVIGSVVDAISGGRSAFEALGSSLSGLIPYQGPIRDGFESIRSVLGQVTTAVGPFASQIIANLASVGSAVFTSRSAFDGLTSSLSGLIPYQGPVRDGFEAIRTGIAGIQSIAASAFAPVAQGVATIASALTTLQTSPAAQAAFWASMAPAVNAVGSAMSILSNAVNVLVLAGNQVVTWISTFVTHLNVTNTSGVRAASVLSSVSNTVTVLAVGISNLALGLIRLAALITEGANRLGVFKFAGDAITFTFGLLGDTVRLLATGLGLLGRDLGGYIGTAFSAFKVIVDTITGAVNNAAAAIRGLIEDAQRAAAAIGGIPGVKLGGDVLGNLGKGIDQVAGNLPHFDLGGVVPGSGPQLVVAHGGETITPPGRMANSAPVSHTTHVVLQLDGTTIAEHVERRIFNNAEGATSGFAGSPVLLD